MDQQKLVKMNIPHIEDITKKSKKFTSPIYIKHNYPDFYEYLKINYQHLSKITEMMYWYYNDLKEYPVCKNCGAQLTNYRGFIVGYGEYCSPKCVAQSEITKNKIKKTKKDAHEDENYNNRTKAVLTCQERYNTDNPFKSKEIQKIIKETNLAKYGVEYPSQSPYIRSKSISTWINHYGVDHPMKSAEIRSKVLRGNLNSILNNNIDRDLLGYTEDSQRIMKCPHPECNKCSEKCYIIPGTNYFARKKYNIELCTKLLPIKQGRNSGTQIELFVQKILDEHNIEYLTNQRNIIKDREIDIYIPSKKLAIECNGCYWHSFPKKPKNYHINKFEECKKQGIQLIQIWEDWVVCKPEIVKSLLLSKLGIYKDRIYARKCAIKEIDYRTSSEFLENNHIQGSTNPGKSYGLFYKDNLIGTMVFGGRNGCWELKRFCTLLNTQVIGAAGKLLKYFIRTHHPTKIISFSSNDISNGNLYKSLGFETEGSTTLSYWYVEMNTYKRFHRSFFQKSRLIKGGCDKNLSESQIMSNLPYYKIYDSGHIKWVLRDIL